MKQAPFGMTKRIFLLFFASCATVCMAFSTPLSAQEPDGAGANEARPKNWSMLGGYGISHTSIGKTRVQVQVLDLIPRYEKILIDDIGSSWYRGRHSLLVELPLTWVFDPDTAPMVGVNVLGAWTLTSSADILPYFFGGGGILYTDADIPGLGSELNGNWQFGVGVRLAMSDGNWLSFEYRFHHISNTGAKDPNDPINSSRLLLGITF